MVCQYTQNHKSSNCVAMGHQNAKKLIYSETLYKTESPKINSTAQRLRRGGGGGGLNITSTIPVISKSTKMSCKT